MKYFAVLSLVLLMAGCGNPQPETDPAINIPAEDVNLEVPASGVNVPNLTAGIDLANQNACRANMYAVAASITMYQAQHGELPATIEQAMGGSPICPDAGAYRYTIDGQNWKLECQAVPSHGFIENGGANW